MTSQSGRALHTRGHFLNMNTRTSWKISRADICARTASLLATLVCVIAFAPRTQCQSTAWTELTSATPPPSPRQSHEALTYDVDRDVIVLFGGGSPVLQDTWEWDGTSWHQRHPLHVPPARRGHVMEYDPIRQVTLMFGGGDGTNLLNDTWVWDGVDWTELHPSTPPSTRSYSQVAFHKGRGTVVLFGGEHGSAANNQLRDSWEWDGSQWHALTPANPPPARNNGAMTYDSSRGVVVLFGGWNTSGYRADTWEWDGNPTGAWVERTPAGSPAVRRGHSLDYDAARGLCVLFGGRRSNTLWAGDTWEYDGANNRWTMKSPIGAPAIREIQGAAYDTLRRRIVMFGGADSTTLMQDTWMYAPVHAARFDPHGTGCAGTAGIPMLDGDPTLWPRSLPWVGAVFEARLQRIGSNPNTDVPFMLVGGSSAPPYPIDLSAIGMTGCLLYTNPMVTIGMQHQSASFASWQVAIPNAVGLVGSTLYTQCVVTDAGANPTGLVTSNYCTLTIGGK